MKALRSLLEKRKEFKKISFDDKDVFHIFRRVVREEYGNIGVDKFTPDFFKNKTLFVKSESSAWANELWMNQAKIVKKINQELGDETVKRIKTK